MNRYTLHNDDNLNVLRAMPDNSVDSIVTDPPYGLSFMGKKWDYDVPSVELWTECLRVLKPGGHLLAFAGTRTQHRMAVRIEDAGFEIRDMICWLYGSGFPKSLDVSKAIDKAAGAEREVLGKVRHRGGPRAMCPTGGERQTDPSTYITEPATEAARQWQGWGTNLKPSIETVTFASKPYTVQQERDITMSNLIRLEARLWLLSPANVAENPSTSSRSEYDAACAIAQWSAGEVTSTRDALCDLMGTSQFESALTTSLSTVLSWRRILEECWGDASMSTTGTASSMTIDWKTLRFSVSQITHDTIVRACSHPNGFSAGASTAERHFNASLLLLQSIRTLSATEPAMSQEQQEHRDADVKPNLDPCIMARKPFDATIAENVLTYGTGGLNIEGCRVGTEPVTINTWDNGAKPFGNGAGNPFTSRVSTGRWPANTIHDGSDEVVNLFPDAGGGFGKRGGGNGGEWNPTDRETKKGQTIRGGGELVGYGDSGSAARFFYCAKASRTDRHSGMEDPGSQFQHGATLRKVENTHTTGNNHPTVKPTQLMRYLCRLVTPPDGIVLDPFMGSGSTGKAALLEGFRFTGIEREPAYMAIAERRIAHASPEPSMPSNVKTDIESVKQEQIDKRQLSLFGGK